MRGDGRDDGRSQIAKAQKTAIAIMMLGYWRRWRRMRWRRFARRLVLTENNGAKMRRREFCGDACKRELQN